MVRRVGPVCRLHLDGSLFVQHLAGCPVLRPRDRRHLAAWRLAGGPGPRAAPGLAGRCGIGRRRRGDVRAGRLVIQRHA